MSTTEVIQELHYDAEATMAVLETYYKQLIILYLVKGIMSYKQIISSCLYIQLKGTCLLACWSSTFNHRLIN